MRIILITFALIGNSLFSQNKLEAEKIVNEGIPYHDKGDYAGAIDKYDKALQLDKDNLLALSEKAMSLNYAGQFDLAIEAAKQAIKTHQGEDVKNVYVSYGNSLDQRKRTDEAINVYDEGLKLYPDYYQLHFNKGITYSSVKKYDKAIESFQNSLLINPNHAGSLNAIGILEMEKNRIPSILAFSRLLIVEQQTTRSQKALEYLQNLLIKGVEKTGKKAITIHIDPSTLPDTTATAKQSNDFSSTDMILSLTSSLDYEKKNEKKTIAENFIRKFETICASLQETKGDNFGFYWESFVPYFVDMKSKNLITPFAYILFSNQNMEDVSKWMKKNQKEVDRFYMWSKQYYWKIK